MVTVTPDLAQEWLGHNTRNRGLKNSKIEQYARDIAGGRWRVTGEAIKFSAAGRLLDGQNRLHAVIRADKPISTLVVFGVRDEAQDVMDSGAARTAADALAMAGVKNSARVASAARIALSIEQTGRAGRRSTNSEVQEWVFDHPEILDAPSLLGSDSRLIPVPPAISVYVAYRFMLVDRVAAVEFLAQLATGVGVTGSDSPVLALRRRLSGVSYGAQRRISMDEQLMAIFRAWNAWRQGRTLARVLADDKGIGLPDLV